jgi:hypothetical protein
MAKKQSTAEQKIDTIIIRTVESFDRKAGEFFCGVCGVTSDSTEISVRTSQGGGSICSHCVDAIDAHMLQEDV